MIFLEVDFPYSSKWDLPLMADKYFEFKKVLCCQLLISIKSLLNHSLDTILISKLDTNCILY